MDGMHDLGGKEGFGPIVYAFGESVYHEAWEARAHALASLARKLKLFNIDEYRHAIERMEPRHYMNSLYYERVFTACATLCVEKGIMSADELSILAGGEFPLARAIALGRSNRVPGKQYEIGATVLIKNEFVSGHVRLPAYARGKQGLIVGVSPPMPFPDAVAHGLSCVNEVTYDVSFSTQHLWPEASEPGKVCLSVFHSYIERESGMYKVERPYPI